MSKKISAQRANLTRSRRVGLGAVLALLLSSLLGPLSALADHGNGDPGGGRVGLPSDQIPQSFNRDGNVLISDQFNNRVIEVNASGNIVWSFGLGPNDFSANSIIGVNDAQRVGPFTLMAGTGTPLDLMADGTTSAMHW